MKKLISSILLIALFVFPASAVTARWEPCDGIHRHGSSKTSLGYFEEREYSDRIERYDAYKCDWCGDIIWVLGAVFYL